MAALGLNEAGLSREGGPGTAPPPARRRRVDPTRSGFWIQAGALAAVLALAAWITSNVIQNLERLGINTGFGFLSRPAGFEIAQRLIPYTEQSSYAAAFLVALLNTVVLAGVCIVLATILGFAVGFARLSRNRLMSGVAGAFVETVRNVPLLLQLLFWYFAVLQPLPGPRQSVSLLGVVHLNNRGLYLPAPVFEDGVAPVILVLAGWAAAAVLAWAARRRRIRTGRPATVLRVVAVALLLLPPLAVAALGAGPEWSLPALSGFNFRGGIAVIPEFVAMAAGLSIYSAAFIAEIVRGGVRSVPAGQAEAARALGLNPWQVVTKVVIPLALRAIVPPLGGQYVLLLKNSSLAAAIGYPDLMLIFAGTALNQTGQPLEIMIITLATYLFLSLGLALATGAWNRRLALVRR